MTNQTPILLPPRPERSAAYQQPVWMAYMLAIMLVLATLLSRLALGFKSGDTPITVLFVPSIILCAYMGGFRPGLLATLLATIITSFVLLPRIEAISFTSRFQLIHIAALFISGVLISFLSEELHRARRRAEANQETTGRLAAIVESSSDAIIGKDLQNMVTSWNASAARMFGYTASEIIGQPITWIIPPQLRDAETAKITQVQGGDQGQHFETVCQHKDGSLIDVLVVMSPIRDANGQIIGTSKVAHDITEQKRIEAALRESERKLSTLVELLPIGISILDSNLKVAYTNSALKHIVGLNDEEIASGRYRERHYIRPDGTPMPQTEFASARAIQEQRAVSNVEIGIVQEDSSTIWTNVSAVPVNLADWCVVVVSTSITDRKQAEQALRESEQRLRVVTETAQVGLVIVDAQHRYRYANRAYANIFHLPTAEIVGLRVADVLAPVYENQIRPRLQRAFGGERINYELVVPPAQFGGEERHYEVNYEKGEYQAEAVVVVVVVDISERKRAELALQRSANLMRVRDDASRAFAEVGQEYQLLLNQVAQTISVALSEGCTIRLLERDEVTLSVVALYDHDPEKLAYQRTALTQTPLRLDEPSLSSQVFQSQQSLIIPVMKPDHVSSVTKSTHWEYIERMGIHTMLLVPMRVQGRSIGVLMVYRYHPEQPPFDQQDLMLAQDLTDRAALAISNARLLSQVQHELSERKRAEATLKRYADRLQHLHEIDSAILMRHALIEIVQDAIAHLGHLIPSTRIAMVLIDTGAETLSLYALQLRGERQTPTILPGPLTMISEMLDLLNQGQVYYVPNIAELESMPPLLRMAHADHLDTFFMVPILIGGELVATLNIGADQAHCFTAEHIDIAREVGDQLSIALQQSRLRQQVERHGQELEERVVARTAELESANRELEAFSYSVSHDLRAPLRAINGFTRILLEEYAGEISEEARHYFNLVQDNAQKMGNLVDDLLTFSRLSRQPLKKRLVDPTLLVNQCLQELYAEQEGRQIDIHIGDLPVCQADSALLKQVWFNLLANALKYTRRRELVVIVISAQLAGRETVYSIKDNGVGFDMRYSDKLFGVFQRMHRAEDYEGTGVGLAIVQRIVQRHGGRVWAEAAMNQGATFFFTLGKDTP